MDLKLEAVDTIVIGAGFSVAATRGKTPLMKGFFDQVTDKDYPTLVKTLKCLGKQSSISEVNIEELLLLLDQVNNCTPKISSLLGAEEVQANYKQIRRELANYVLYRFRDCFEYDLDSWAIPLLYFCNPRTTVISMNYDNLAERLLSNREGQRHGSNNTNCPHCKMKNLLHRACTCVKNKFELRENDWRGAIIKLHGSISWRRCPNSGCCTYECLVADEHCRPFERCLCKYCSVECEPALIMPSMEKKLIETPEIGIMWEAAKSALAETETLLVIGYSFPTSDELLRQLVKASLFSRKLRSVCVIDLYPDDVIARIKPCVPDECTVEYSSLPVIPGQQPEWFKMPEVAKLIQS